jgi:hypothetical protein
VYGCRTKEDPRWGKAGLGVGVLEEAKTDLFRLASFLCYEKMMSTGMGRLLLVLVGFHVIAHQNIRMMGWEVEKRMSVMCWAGAGEVCGVPVLGIRKVIANSRTLQ